MAFPLFPLGSLGPLTIASALMWGASSGRSKQAQNIDNSAFDALYADREHTEMREDTAYQRAVADMKAAGLNPLALGGVNPAASSPSVLGQNVLETKLGVLGNLLSLDKLNSYNLRYVNDMIGESLKSYDSSMERMEDKLLDFFQPSSGNLYGKAK